jgi:hypothetical protein
MFILPTRTMVMRNLLSVALILAAANSPTLASSGTDSANWAEGKVLFQIYHGRQSNKIQDPLIRFVMRTEKIYGCYNFVIVADLDTLPGRVIVTLRGLDRSDACEETMGPATFHRVLRLSAGTYTLVIRTSSTSDSHTLVLDDSAIRVLPGDSTISKPVSTLNWKFPAHSFVSVCGTTTDKSWLCQAFRDSLRQVSSIHEFTFPDSGAIPYPTESTGYWYNEPAHYFFYDTEADFDSAGAILKRFVSHFVRDQQGIALYLLNWRNKQYK